VTHLCPSGAIRPSLFPKQVRARSRVSKMSWAAAYGQRAPGGICQFCVSWASSFSCDVKTLRTQSRGTVGSRARSAFRHRSTFRLSWEHHAPLSGGGPARIRASRLRSAGRPCGPTSVYLLTSGVLHARCARQLGDDAAPASSRARVSSAVVQLRHRAFCRFWGP